jgi:hypothetical protein
LPRLKAIRIDSPKLFNSDGDEVLFHKVTFPLTEAASVDAVAERINQLADLRQASATLWNWLGDRAANCAKAKGAKGIVFNSSMEDGSPVLGTIELKKSFVVLRRLRRFRKSSCTKSRGFPHF